MVATLTALAILLAVFAAPPAHSPGISISRANAGDPNTASAEHLSRDAEEDAADEHELLDLGACDPTATAALVPPAASHRGQPQPAGRRPAAGRQHGPDCVRGPPA